MPADTKQLIASKLFELLDSEKPENITVTQLVTECGISRQTFYYHFKDIVDVMEWGIGNILKRDLEKSLTAAAPRDALRIFVEQAVDSHAAIDHLLKSSRGYEFSQLLNRIMSAYLWELFTRMFPNSRLSVADTDAALSFYTGGITVLILSNYDNRNLDISILVDQIFRLLSGEMLSDLLGADRSLLPTVDIIPQT